ncbi:MAG: hypothetical protein SFY92_00990 [Verrucomicrobiae bacterium]|nr:hypothetical protein [Verrucomicrobiae bacterium]
MKSFYSWVDFGFLPHIPQSLQHLANRDMAEKAGGRIIFYGAEEPHTVASQELVRAKLERTGPLEGFVFFSVFQFCYGPEFHFSLLKTMVESRRMEVHFAREGISIRNPDQLREQFDFLYSMDFTRRRESANDPFFRNLLASV